MYESPITQILGEIQTTVEDDCMKVVQQCGFDVNKEELIKALSYDRNQYAKGYEDGYEKAIDDFVNKLDEHQKENWIDNLEYGITWNDIEQVAQNLKAGATNGNSTTDR